MAPLEFSTGTILDFNTPRHTTYPCRGVAGIHRYIVVVLSLLSLFLTNCLLFLIALGFMFSHCFTGVLTIHSDLLRQLHSAFSTSLLHCLWTYLGYLFQLSVRFFMVWLACKLAISVFLHQLQGHLFPSSSGHPPYILRLWNSSTISTVGLTCIWRVLGCSGKPVPMSALPAYPPSYTDPPMLPSGAFSVSPTSSDVQ